jgi:valine dehydrogenase (NAD+)
VLYAPDYLVNAGGVIQVGDEAAHLHDGGFSFERAKSRAARIFDTTLEILRRSKADGVPPAATADRLAEERMRDVSRLRGILLPS